jgi:hypothetical protein
MAAAELRGIRRAGSESGGTVAEVSRLSALGIPEEQIAGTAAGLRQRVTTDYGAMQAAAQLGLKHPGPRWAGEQDEAKILLETMEALRIGSGRVENAEQQLRLARELGMEGMLDQINVSPKVWRAMKEDARVREAVADPKYLQASRDLDAQVRRAADSFGNLKAALGAPAIQMAADTFGKVADWINKIAERIGGNEKKAQRQAYEKAGYEFDDRYPGWMKAPEPKTGEQPSQWVRQPGVDPQADALRSARLRATMAMASPAALAAQAANGPAGAGIAATRVAMAYAASVEMRKWEKEREAQRKVWKAQGYEFDDRKPGWMKSPGRAASAGGWVRIPELEDAADATRENTEEMRRLNRVLQEGIHGGGERARGAIPKGWKGGLVSRTGFDRAARMGAWAFT